MTPEQRAAAARERYASSRLSWYAEIASAIRAAILEEREACAELLKAHAREQADLAEEERSTVGGDAAWADVLQGRSHEFEHAADLIRGRPQP